MAKKERPKDDILHQQLSSTSRLTLGYLNAGLPLVQLETMTQGGIDEPVSEDWKELTDSFLLMEYCALGQYVYSTLPEKAKICDQRGGLLTFHNNQFTNLAIRRKAQPFIEATDCDSIFDWLIVLGYYCETEPIPFTYESMYYITYFLTCIRNAIRINDFRRRGFEYNPRYIFENSVSFVIPDYQKSKETDQAYIHVWHRSFFSDILMDLLSVFCNKEYSDKEYVVNIFDEHNLLQSSIVKYVESSGGSKKLAAFLLWLWEQLLTFEAILKRISINNDSLAEAQTIYNSAYNDELYIVACVKILKLIFRKIVRLESFARTI